MRITFVTEKTLNGAWQDSLSSLKDSDVVVFGFNGLGLVSYKKELNGETEYFQDVARLSRQLNCTVISGCDTDTYGVVRHSAVIADRGKLLGVSDMAHTIDESEFVSGGNFRVYDTESGKIGIIVGEDLFFPETARVLSLCDAHVIVCVFKNVDSPMPQVMLRAGAFANGVVTLLCAKKCAMIADITGKVTLASNKDVIGTDIKIEKDYRLISSRRRGLYRDFKSGY